MLFTTSAYAWKITFKQTFDRGLGYDISCNNGKSGYVEYLNNYGNYWVMEKYFDTLDQAANYICR